MRSLIVCVQIFFKVFGMCHVYLVSCMCHPHPCLFYFSPYIPDHFFWPIFLQKLNKLFYEDDVCMLSSSQKKRSSRPCHLFLFELTSSPYDTHTHLGGKISPNKPGQQQRRWRRTESNHVFMSLQIHQTDATFF